MKALNVADFIGMKFGRLTVIGSSDIVYRNRTFFSCKCDCGNAVSVRVNALRSGNTKSCGCFKTEVLKSIRNIKHGKYKSRTYSIWRAMKRRCLEINDISYKYYGGRGIAVCSRWLDFENFLLDMGEAPANFSIDRIDVNKNYEPANCKWANQEDQANNKRNNTFITYENKTQTVSQWAREKGINKTTLIYRIKKGFVSDALFKPVNEQKRRNSIAKYS